MATRIQGTYFSYGRRAGSGSSTYSTWLVEIDDADYAGAALEVDLEAMRFSWQAGEEGIFSPIVTSTCELELIINSNDLDDFVTDQVDFEEGRFKMRVVRNGVLYWCGFLLPDLVRARMQPIDQGYVFTIKATDGLARLKTIDFNDAGTPYTGKISVFDLMFLLLEKVGLTSYFSSGGTQVFLYVQSTWWASEHAGKASTANFLSNTRVNHRVWRRIDTRDGSTLYRSAWEVLEQVCLAFGLRLIFSDGKYWLTEVAQYGATGTIRYQSYAVNKAARVPLAGANWAGFKRTTGTVAQWNAGTADVMVFPNSEETFYPALRETKVIYKHYSTDNLISGTQWSSANLSAVTIEDVDHNGGASRVAITFSLTVKLADSSVIDFTAIPATWFEFHIKIAVNNGSTTYYLRREATFSGGTVTFGNPEWTTTSTHRVKFWVGPQTVDNAQTTHQIQFVSPPMPDSGDMEVLVIYNSSARLDGVLPPSGTRTITYATGSAYLEIFADGNIEDQYNYTQYSASNTDDNNSEAPKPVELLLGDGPTLNAYGAVEVYNGSAWVKPTGWGRLAAATYTQAMGQLLAQERLGMQDKPVKRWNGSMQGDYFAMYLLVRSHDSAAYIVQQVSLDAYDEIWQGTWVQVGYNTTKVTNNPQQQFITNPIGGPDGDEPPGLSSGLPALRALTGTLFADRYDGGVNRQSGAQSGLNAVIARNVPLVLNTAINSGDVLTSMSVKASPYAVASGYYGSIWPGDRIDLVNPTTGEYQTFHVTARAGWSTSTAFNLTVSSATVTYSFPQGSYIFLNGAFEFQYGTRNWNIRSYQVVLFGRTTAVTTGHSEQFIAVNNHTFFAFFQINFVTPGTDKINITVYVNGVALPGYPSNLDTTSDFVESSPNYTLAQGDIISIGVNSVSGTAPIGMAFTVILAGNANEK